MHLIDECQNNIFLITIVSRWIDFCRSSILQFHSDEFEYRASLVPFIMGLVTVKPR